MRPLKSKFNGEFYADNLGFLLVFFRSIALVYKFKVVLCFISSNI